MLPLVAKDQMSANFALDNEILREVIEKNSRAERRIGHACMSQYDWGELAIHFNKRKPLRKRLPARVKNPLVTPDQNSFRMNFKIGVMETESKFCTRSPGVRLRTATSNDLTDRTEGLFLTPTFSGL